MKKNGGDPRRCKTLQNKGTPVNAPAANCCAWTHKNALFNHGVYDRKLSGNLCGQDVKRRDKASGFKELRKECCANEDPASTGDCDSSTWPKGPCFRSVLEFAADATRWLDHYVQAWKVATENGHLGLRTPSANPAGPVTEALYECGRLRTRKLCKSDAKCSWSVEKVPGRRMKRHCVLK